MLFSEWTSFMEHSPFDKPKAAILVKKCVLFYENPTLLLFSQQSATGTYP